MRHISRASTEDTCKLHCSRLSIAETLTARTDGVAENLSATVNTVLDRLVTDAASASALMRVTPSVIKRPVVAWADGVAGGITVGFNPESWATRLQPKA